MAAIGETAPDGCARSNFEIGVRENEHRVLSAQLQHGRNQFAPASFGDAAAGGDAAGEGNFVRTGVDDAGAKLTRALQNLDQTRRKLGLFD